MCRCLGRGSRDPDRLFTVHVSGLCIDRPRVCGAVHTSWLGLPCLEISGFEKPLELITRCCSIVGTPFLYSSVLILVLLHVDLMNIFRTDTLSMLKP